MAIPQLEVQMPQFNVRDFIGLTEKNVAQAWVRGSNRGLSKAKTTANKTLRRVYNVDARAILGKQVIKGGKRRREQVALFAIKATLRRPTATLLGRGFRLAIIRFKPKQTPEGVTFQIRRGGGTRSLKSRFIAQMKSGHVGVWERHKTKKMRDKPKAALTEKYTLSIPEMLGARKVNVPVHKTFVRNAAKEFDRQLDRMLAKKRVARVTATRRRRIGSSR